MLITTEITMTTPITNITAPTPGVSEYIGLSLDGLGGEEDLLGAERSGNAH